MKTEVCWRAAFRRNPYESNRIYRIGPPEVLQLQEVKKPALNEDQVLAKAYAASINAGDIYGLV
jgi:NADPH:quinone reductase-like Zn-dependent oxidoreductase